MIQITRQGVVPAPLQQELDFLRSEYGRNNYVILPRLIEPDLFEILAQRVECASFATSVHKDITRDLLMEDKATLAALNFIASHPTFLRIVEQITGCPPLVKFIGRVYRITATDGHYSRWHDDNGEGRAVTMSLNLSRRIFGGGSLQMKKRNTNELSADVRNTGFGDALLFRISDKFVHRVQGVEGDVPKTALAGWFFKKSAPGAAVQQNDAAHDGHGD